MWDLEVYAGKVRMEERTTTAKLMGIVSAADTVARQF